MKNTATHWLPLPFIGLLTGFILSVTSCNTQQDNESLTSASKRLTTESVTLIHTHELAEKLKHNKSVVLLDAREENEFEVSHLPEARWVGYKTFNLESISDLPLDTPVTIYCSVGYRSEKIGERLQEAGFSNVTNLFGGIFMWANQTRPLSDHSGQATTSVHGYNQQWSEHLSADVIKHLD